MNRPDVAILATTNMAHGRRLQRIAVACVERGLATAIVLPTLGGPASVPDALYEGLGARLYRLRQSPGRGLCRYPRMLSIRRVFREIAADFRELRPRALITHIDDGGVFRAAHVAAKQLGVLGIVTQEGMAAPQIEDCGRRSWNLERAREAFSEELWRAAGRVGGALYRRQFENTFADIALVWGDAMARLLVAQGRSEETIAITGCPDFDDTRAPAAPAYSRPRAVLVAHQNLRDIDCEIGLVRAVAKACAGPLASDLIVKLHPFSRLSPRDFWAALEPACRAGRRVEVVHHGMIEDLFARASVFVTAFSSSAYGALMAGLALVVPDYLHTGVRFETECYGAALRVRDEDGWESVLTDATENAATRERLWRGSLRLLHDHLGPLDGKAAQRIADETARRVDAEARRRGC